MRGRELVERIAGQLTERLGPAELLWSRVSREPYATVALRPGVVRPGPRRAAPASSARGRGPTPAGPRRWRAPSAAAGAAAQLLLEQRA